MRRFAQIVLVVLLGFGPYGAKAQEPEPFPDFTFKRIKVPKPGSGPRITVQISPQDGQESAGPAKPDEDKPKENDSFDWFWQEISPSLTATAPGRLTLALSALENGEAVREPSLSNLHQIIKDYSADILLATVGTEVSPALALAVIAVESAGKPGAISSAGAQGLMQLMPGTAARFGTEDALVPADNIKAGVAYLDFLMSRFERDPILVLAAYNSGESAIDRYEGVPPFDETRGYVPKVLTAWRVARSLCKTPPELISDGCALQSPES